MQEAHRTPDRQNQKRKSSQYIILKTVSIYNKGSVFKGRGEKNIKSHIKENLTK